MLAKLILVPSALGIALWLALDFGTACTGGPGPDPEPQDELVGAGHGSPEDSVVDSLVNEFSNQRISVSMTFFEGDFSTYKDSILAQLLEERGHVDFLFVRHPFLEALIQEGWIKPFPMPVDTVLYDPAAISAVTRNDTIMGLPIFTTADAEVKAVYLSRMARPKSEDLVVNLMQFLSLKDNSARIAQAAGGTPARLRDR